MEDKMFFKVLCTKCKSNTNHRCLLEYHKDECDEDPDGQPYYQARTTYQTIQCVGCEEVSFRSVHSSNMLYDPETGDYTTFETLYPERNLGHRQTRAFKAVPDNLRHLYQQTISAFNLKMDVLCAGGLRAIIEGLCAEQGVSAGPVPKRHQGVVVLQADGTPLMVKSETLEGKIEGLAEKAILTAGQAKVLHEHRYMGNEALHELKAVPRDDLAMAIDIVEHTYSTVYELPIQQSILERRRLRRQT